MRRVASLFGTFALLILPAVAAGQAPQFQLVPGERIEIAAPVPDGRLVPATVRQWEPGWLAFELEDGQVWSRHTYDVDQIRVRRAVPLGRRVRAGVAWGVFLGGSIGGIVGPFAARGVAGENDAWTAVGISAGAGAAAGAAIGAAVGATVRRSSWVQYLFRAPEAR